MITAAKKHTLMYIDDRQMDRQTDRLRDRQTETETPLSHHTVEVGICAICPYSFCWPLFE